MKICIVGPASPFRGGIAQFSNTLAQSLRKSGHDVLLVNFIEQYPRLLFPGQSQFEESPPKLDVPSVRVFTLWKPWTWLSTAKAIRRHHPDLILFAWWFPLFGPGYWGVMKLLGSCRARIGFLLHNVIPHEKRFGDKRFTRMAFSRSDFFIVQSRAVERDLLSWFPNLKRESIAYSPHPLYDCYPKYAGTAAEARQELGLPADAPVLLFFGFVRPYKGLDILLRAMPDILRHAPKARLLVVGEFYDPRADYDKQIAELGIAEHVTVRDDYCPADEVGTYFAACDAVVLPYRSATQSGIIQMAYALDTPVITTDVGGLSEVVLDGVTGYVVPPENPPAIAEGARKFFAAGGRPAFVENVRRESRKYSWETFVGVLEKLAHERHPASP